jgi:O-antigen/teichoic acid export membrane protein
LLLFLFTNNYAITGAFSIVGGYALAGLLITNFTWPLITHIAEAHGKKDLEKIRFNLRLVIKLFFYITFLILAVTIGISQGLIYVFYGPTYLMGSTDIWIPFILTITASTISSFEYIICCVLLGIGRKRPAAIYLGILFLVTSGLIALLLKLNLFTPSISTGLGYLMGILVMLPVAPYLLRKEINQKIPFSVGLRSLLALLCTLSIAIIVIWPPLNLIRISNMLILSLSVVVLGFIYLFLLIFFGSMSKNDFDLFDEQFKGTRLEKILIFSAFFRKLAKFSPFSQYEKKTD